MIFLITQTHAPESMPSEEEGGIAMLFKNPEEIPDFKLKKTYYSSGEHTVYYIIETKEYERIDEFLKPGLDKTLSVINPVEKID